MHPKLILSIECSCDDTSVAIMDTDYKVLSNLIASQLEHDEFGGVLPELASRLHLKNILYLVEKTLYQAQISLKEISAVAVSINPGLIGSLIVGLSFAKSLAWTLSLPLITVNHLLSHIFSNYIEHPSIEAPFLALVVSGGHTEMVYFSSEIDFEIVGRTVDDAAGETFDKTAKLLGLGYPGGPLIDKLSRNANPDFVHFPRAKKDRTDFDFSFSGLKTAVKQHLSTMDSNDISLHKADLAASIQAAIVEPLVQKSIRWSLNHRVPRILLAGGVAANSHLRSTLSLAGEKHGIEIYYPSLQLCLDNAAMVAAAAIPKLKKNMFSPLDVNASSLKGTKLM